MLIKTKQNKDGTFLNEYWCVYCDNDFTKLVKSVGEGNSRIVSQIRCPRCRNFLPTWE